jgi:osmotically-inducible protein OsmY
MTTTKDPPGDTVSPAEVHHALVASLARHAAEEAAGVDVGALGGEVWLCGRVDSDLVRELLIEAAGKVPGVTIVHDMLELSGRDNDASPNARRTP